MSSLIWTLVADIAAIMAMIAAHRAHVAWRSAEATLVRADSALALAISNADSVIASVRSSRASRLASATSACRISSHSTHSSALRQNGESGAWPCLPSAISRLTPEGPIDSKCAMVSDVSSTVTPNV